MLHLSLPTTAHVASWLMLLAVLSSPGVFAAPPTIERLSVYGLQSGGTTTLAIDGANLASDLQAFVHDIPIATQRVKPGATPQRAELEVTVDSWAAPGIYDLRVVTAEGISNRLPVAVDGMPQLAWGAEVASLPVALSGMVNGNQTLSTKFPAKKSQPIVLEIEAQRIGSQLRPVLHVYDDRHVQVAWANAISSLGDDARVVFQPPADGVYSVEVHDSRYSAPAPGYFRLKIGAFEYADVAVPAAVQSGTKQVLRFAVSNLPVDAAAEFAAPQIPIRAPAAWPVRPMLSGPRPAIMVTDEPQAIETPSSSASKDLQVFRFPGGVTGRLSQPREQDRYRLSAPPGTKIRLALSAQRIGSPLDGVLAVLEGNGGELATADDGNRTTDPALEFTFPEKSEAVTLVVKDVLRRGGSDFVYHLSAKPVDAADFSLSFEENRLQVAPKGNALLKVQAKRTGYAGPIRLRLTGLPLGIHVAEGEIPTGSDVGFCLLSGIGLGPTFGVANILGEAEMPDAALIRQALGPASGAAASSPWLRGDLGVALTSGTAPLSIELTGPPEQLPSRLPLGGQVDLPLAISRAGDVAGDVKLSLVSTQRADAASPPANQNRRGRRNRKKNPAENTKVELLRLTSDAPLGPSSTQSTASVVVPHDLPVGDYGVAIRADLLAADGKAVLATAYARPRWMKAVIPFSVKLEKSDIQVRAGDGETGELAGTIVRTDGFAGPVTISVEGLPQGIVTPTLHLPAAECDFRFPVSLPFGVKSAPIKAKLTSLGKLGSDKSQDGIEGVPIDLVLNVVPGEKPKAEKPLAIFEDEQDFADDLTEGEGVVALFDQDKFSGEVALLVKQKPRFRTALPGLGVKIRENPEPGEYRYLRFAWKTVGNGQRIGLQLIDGAEAGKVTKYNYHAGSGPTQEGQAVVVDQNPPAKWTVVTRDLFADFGELTLTGIGTIYFDGKSALFDHIYLGRSVADLDYAKP